MCYGAVGIWVGLSGNNNVVHNEARHHPDTGISVGWRRNSPPKSPPAGPDKEGERP